MVAACGGGGEDGAVSDTTPPTVSATAPATSATGVALNSSVSATFSEPMTNSTLTTASFLLATTAGGAAVTGTVGVSGNTATFTPSAPLAGNTQYTATITTAAKDAAGNALAANYSWSFTTGTAPDTTPPTVSSTSPVNNATGVATTSSVSATFSEPMTNSTLTTASFLLATTAGGTAVTGTVGVSGNTATFTPSAPLAGDTQYTATITTAAKDAAGNALAANYSWSFTTVMSKSGLDFPSNLGSPDNSTSVRFRFTGAALIPIYGTSGNGVTYLWKYRPRQQTGYYTCFFWGNDDGIGNTATFEWDGGQPDTYYGAHPFPADRTGFDTDHEWEIAVENADFTDTEPVVKDVWYSQAFRSWGANGAVKNHEYYWNLPNTTTALVTHATASTWGNQTPPSPALTWGDAPWNPSQERSNGVLRGWQIYNALLNTTQINALGACETDACVLSTASSLGVLSSLWYLNMNPADASDISDKSGNGHHPAWWNSNRPLHWTQ